MGNRVILVEVGREIRALLGHYLSKHLVLEDVASTEQMFLKLEQSTHHTGALVLGLRLEEPVSIAQRVHSLGRDLPVVILSHPNRCSQLKQALQFSPFVGSEVIGWSIEFIDRLPAALLNIVNRAQKRRAFRGKIQAAQRRLGELTREPPRLTHYLDRLLEHAPIGVLNVEASGKVLSVNRRACQILALSEREALGMPLTDLFPVREHERLREMMARCVASSRQHAAEIFEIAPRTNGHDVFVEVTAASLVDRTGQLGTTIILQDVTDRIRAERERKQAEEDLRKSEAQLRLVTDAMPVLISYIDTQHRYRFNNKAYEDWFGYPRRQLSGRHVSEVIGEQAYEIVRPKIEAAFLGRAVESDMVLPYKSRGKRHVRVNFIPHVSENGSILGVVIVVSDITEYKKAEEREKQQMLELAHVSRVMTLGEMSSQLAHELAQPLTAIANFSDASLRMMKASTEPNEEILESLTDIASQADRAREIIVQLRNFVRKDEVRRSAADVNDLVRGVVRLGQVETRWNALELKLELGDSLPLVLVDKTLIEQVILNLIHNAIEAMQTLEREAWRLTIKTWRNGEDIVEVAVSDNGPGLPTDTPSRIFEPFFTTKREGMGMGLAITRSIVDAHGGHLQAANNEQGGATFRFSLVAQT